MSLPTISADGFSALRNHIHEHGVIVPIILGADGSVIDGEYRLKICAELGITSYPRITLPDYAGERAERLRAALNIVRRQLSTREKQAIIAAELRRDATQSDRDIERTFGFDHKTVGKVRRLGNFPSKTRSPTVLDSALCGNDLVKQPTAILASSASEVGQAVTIAKQGVPTSCRGRTMPVKTVAKRGKRERGRIERALAYAANPITADDIRVEHCRFQELAIESGSVDLIFTDPPYAKEWVPQLADLADFADRALKPGGTLALYYGTFYLPEAIQAITRKLIYRWTASISWRGAGTILHPGGGSVINNWRPILIFSKGDWGYKNRWSDSYHLAETEIEKDLHPWQQPLNPIRHFVRLLSQPGWLVCDPCLGGCTTAVACRELGRRFVGCDVDARAIAIGRERLAKASAA